MRGNKGKMMFGFKRTKIGLPIYILSCSLFFFAGFYGSMLFSQDIAVDTVPRVRLMEERETMIALPHSETGESDPSPIPFQVLSWKPRAFYFPNFATAEQCENIIKKAKSQLRPSKLALRKGETEENTKGVRTSSGTFMSASEDPTGTLKFVEEKIARATMIPRDHGEDFNVLRYEIGQKYASHYDAFSPSEYGPQKSQRVASFLLYLSDVEQGGETMFPYELIIEEICRDIYKGDPSWKIILLRYFNPVGAHSSGYIGEDPRGFPNNLMPFIQQVAVGRRPALTVFGTDYNTKDGTGVRDYIHVVDLADGHIVALQKLLKDGSIGCEVYNLGTGKGTSVLEMVAAFEKVSGKKIPLIMSDRRPGDAEVVYASTSKAENELNWRAKYGIDEMCRDQWIWASKNPLGYPPENPKQ